MFCISETLAAEIESEVKRGPGRYDRLQLGMYVYGRFRGQGIFGLGRSKIVATSLPAITEAGLRYRLVRARIVELCGAVEASIRTGLADAVVERVQSGETLRANGLVAVDTWFSSEAVLVIGCK